MATSKVLKRSISVSNTHRDTVFVYREDVFPNKTPILVQYTPIRVPILVQYTPIRVPILVQYTPIRVPILVQYTPIRVPILVQYTSTREDAGHYEFIVAKSPSNRDGGKLESVPAPPPYSKVCRHRLLTAKCACSQQHPSHSRGRLVRCLNSPLRSKKQGLRKERESPAPAN